MQKFSVRLCVSTPIANEEANIERFIREVCSYLDREDRLILVIDNVSKDNTRDIIKTYVETTGDNRILLIEAPENRCVVDAYIRGYKEALKLNPQWILEMDAGFSHNPATIPDFIQKMSEGFDFVGGSRFVKGASYESGFYRRILSQGGSLVAKILFQTNMTDMTSGFQCFTQESLKLILEKGITSKGTFFQTEIRYWAHSLKWAEIPISYGNTRSTVPSSYLNDAASGLLKLLKTHYS